MAKKDMDKEQTMDTAPAILAGNFPKEKAATQGENVLMTLEDLAARHRVPSWQMAALSRYMGWQDGKQVTDAEFQDALSRLSARPLGGGRF